MCSFLPEFYRIIVLQKWYAIKLVITPNVFSNHLAFLLAGFILMIPIYAKRHSTDSDNCRLRVENVYHLWKYLSELCWVRLWDTLHKKWSFPLRISSVNMTKSAGGFVQFGHFLCSDESWRKKEFSFALRIYWVNTA